MARIRSIKPEFATDGTMLRASDSCALFFVLLWNFCDDEGKIANDPKAIAALTARWKQDKVRLYLSWLINSGQLRVSSCSAWLQVTNWFHQKIDKPRQPRIKASEIQWVDADVSSNDRESSENVRRKDRIGSDRIGSDLLPETLSSPESPKKAPKRKSKKTEDPSDTSELWEAYSESYLDRHKCEPSDNAKIRSQMKNFIRLVGREDAPLIARYYVFHNHRYYVEKRHPFGLLLVDHEKIRTEWLTKTHVTSVDAQHVENKQATLNAWGPLLQEARAKEQDHG